MPNVPHRVGSASDATSIAAGATQYFQIKAISGGKVTGRFYIHALDIASTNPKATCWVSRGYNESGGTDISSLVTISQAEDANCTKPITARDWTASEPGGTAVIADKWKTFTQGQWLSDEHTARHGETLTLCVKNEDDAAISFMPQWKGV